MTQGFRIIKEGIKNRRGVCPGCGCIFECHQNKCFTIDIATGVRDEWTYCPNCNQIISVQEIEPCQTATSATEAG